MAYFGDVRSANIPLRESFIKANQKNKKAEAGKKGRDRIMRRFSAGQGSGGDACQTKRAGRS
jgi:hypothetical protein